MRRPRLLLVLLVTFGFAHATEDEQYFDHHTIRASDIPREAPAFDQYLVSPPYIGPLAPPDVKSHPLSRLFRTMIREGAKRGPNFAGRYTLVFWGCGSSCSSVAIVDARTGKVFHPKNLGTIDNINVAFDELEPPDGHLVKFRLDSKLLIVIGGVNEDPSLRGISYFVWDHERLRRIRFVHKPYE